MYKTNLCFFALVLWGTFACQQQVDVAKEEVDTTQKEVNIAAEEAAIKELIDQQDTAFKRKDLDGEAEVWAHEPYIFRGLPDPHSTFPPVVGWDALRSYYEELFKGASWPLYSDERSNYHIHIADNVAWAVYDQVNTWTNDQGEEESEKFWALRIFEKKAGQWRTVLQMVGEYPKEDS